MRTRRTLIIAILFLGVHFAATITLLLRHLGNGLSFSETLPPAPASPLLEVAVSVLTFPVFALPFPAASRLIWWMPFLLNSLLWTLILFGAFHYSRLLFRKFDPPLPDTR